MEKRMKKMLRNYLVTDFKSYFKERNRNVYKIGTTIENFSSIPDRDLWITWNAWFYVILLYKRVARTLEIVVKE